MECNAVIKLEKVAVLQNNSEGQQSSVYFLSVAWLRSNLEVCHDEV